MLLQCGTQGNGSCLSIIQQGQKDNISKFLQGIYFSTVYTVAYQGHACLFMYGTVPEPVC